MPRDHHATASTRSAFTLIELLVVVAIIMLLAALLLPALKNARAVGKKVYCQNNFKQLHLGMQLYMDDYDGIIAGSLYQGGVGRPDPGQNTWFLAARRNMGNVPDPFVDSLAIWNDPAGWIKISKTQLCPEDLRWGSYKVYGSYGPDTGCWLYFSGGSYVYLRDDGGNFWVPTRTQAFKFGNVRKPEGSVFLTEMLHHGNMVAMDGMNQTANVWDPAYAAGGWLSARHFHPGPGRVPDTGNQYYWEGFINFLFFDGHVEPRQYHPYSFGGVFPKGVNLLPYAQFVQ